jgi:hypothetical protein
LATIVTQRDAVPPSESLGSLKVHIMADGFLLFCAISIRHQIINHGDEVRAVGRRPTCGVRASYHH